MVERLLILLKEIASTILPVLAMLLFFQWVVLRRPLVNGREILLGLCLATFGLIALIYGLRTGVQPLGEGISLGLLERRSVLLFVVFALLIGFFVPLAEPELRVMALQVDEVTSGALSQRLFLFAVALGASVGTTLGTLRILYGIEATHFFIPALAFVLVLTYFAPERYTSLAFDAALSTTGPFTVALAIGIAAALGRSDVLHFGFGIVAMDAIGAMASVLCLGIGLGMMGR